MTATSTGPAPDKGLKRYTNLASLIHILRTRKITLLNPATWDDRNDAYFMSEFKRQAGYQTVLALCFAESSQTYHHWRVFAHGPDGVCIEFDKAKLLGGIAGIPGVSHRLVDYKPTARLKAETSFKLSDLPFVKRSPYRPEKEHRVIYVDETEVVPAKDIPIELNWIRRITLSPWIPAPLAASMKAHLKEIEGCSTLRIYRSQLLENDTWKTVASKALPT